MYMTIKPCDKWQDISSSIEGCIGDISIWIKSKMKKLDKNKTKLIVFSPKKHVKKIENIHIMVNTTMSAKPLGFIWDTSLVNEEAGKLVMVVLLLTNKKYTTYSQNWLWVSKKYGTFSQN